MEDFVGSVSEWGDKAAGAAAAVGGWFAALNISGKWKKVAIFAVVAIAMLIALRIITGA